MIAVALTLAVSPSAAQTGADCRREADDVRRLACYDRIFGEPPAPSQEASAGNETMPLDASTFLDTFWELDPADKRGPFIVRTYQPNFLLPLHYTSSINRMPTSPTHPTAPRRVRYRPQEAKLQISLRAKIAKDVLLPGADLWVTYTQRSLWQLWNRQESSPFRSTDHQPEAIYVLPVPPRLGALPAGWRLRMLQAGIGHESNGQGDPLSRSWNFIFAAAAFAQGDFLVQVRGNRRLRVAGEDDNPDLIRHIGNAEVAASWLPGLSTTTLTWRTGREAWPRGSLQLDWTYPVRRDQPAGLRWYVQLFSGYGETLLDYNHRQSSLGIGLTLFQF